MGWIKAEEWDDKLKRWVTIFETGADPQADKPTTFGISENRIKHGQLVEGELNADDYGV